MIQTMKPTLSLLFAFLFYEAVALAHLGGSVDDCKKAYGEPKFEKVEAGQTVRGYQPSFPDFGSAIVMASFRDDKVSSIRYKIATQSKFTPEQLSFITSLNGLGVGKKFIEVGPTPDGTKQLWATEDYSAYMVVQTGQAFVDFMTQAEAIDMIKQLPSAKLTPPESDNRNATKSTLPSLGPTDQAPFAAVKLAQDVSIELPKAWWLIGKDFNDVIQTSAHAMLDLSGLEKSGDAETVLVSANSMPKTTYASVRVTFSTPPIGTPAEVRMMTKADLDEMANVMKDNMTKTASEGANKLIEFHGCSVVEVDGCPSLMVRYRRSGPHGDVMVRSHQIFRSDGTLNVTLSYRISEGSIWLPVIERIQKSIKTTK